MAEDENKKNPNIFQKAIAAADSWFDQQITKGKNISDGEIEDEHDFFYRKSVSRDHSYYIGAQGYHEKAHRLTYDHLKQMSLKDSIVSAIILTRQNQVAGFARKVHNDFERGFKIILKDEEEMKEAIKEMIREGIDDETIIETLKGKIEGVDDKVAKAIKDHKEKQEELRKAEDSVDMNPGAEPGDQDNLDPEATQPDQQADAQEFHEQQEQEDLSAWRINRKCKELLEKITKSRKRAIEQFLLNGGLKKDRPFESKKWNFNKLLRSVIRDSLTYDQFGIEIVPNKQGKPHHIVPVDGSTIRYASPQLAKYKTFPTQANYDILYPEAEIEALEQKDALDLDPEVLEEGRYKYVQVIRGKIERAFTEEELKVGMRNPTTDVFHNGYSIAELELLVSLVSSHLNTEFYNQAYFSQGFSAKGILHIKAPMNRRKLETIRQQWQHMIKGTRNSFQTPIFAGMDEVNWIPLTQNHSDIEFQGWLHYLIKMICAIYQIDPQEIGVGMKEEGSKGTGLSGDNTQEKIDLSRDKGLYPLLIFLEDFITTNIIDEIDDDFKIKFVGLKEESMKDALERQKREAEFKKTVNEIREEDGLPPLPGMDTFINSATYVQWYQMFSPQAKELENQRQMNEMANEMLVDEEQQEKLEEEVKEAKKESKSESKEKVNKSLRIEYYKLDD